MELADNMLLSTMINNGKPFAAVRGLITSAPFRNFTIEPKLLKHYAKNLVGSSGLGAPKILSGTKTVGAALTLSFTGGSAGFGIGLIFEVSTPRDIAMQVISCTYTIVAGVIVHTVSFKPSAHDSALFGFLSAYSSSNEIFPILQTNPILSFADLAIPDGTTVTARLLDLSDDSTRDFVKNLHSV